MQFSHGLQTSNNAGNNRVGCLSSLTPSGGVVYQLNYDQFSEKKKSLVEISRTPETQKDLKYSTVVKENKTLHFTMTNQK